MPSTKFWAQCLPLSFGSIWQHLAADEVWRFSRWSPWGHLIHVYRNRMILAILNLYVTSEPPIKFGFNLHYGLGDVIWRISGWLPWSYLGCQNGTNLAVLTCHVSQMPIIKFQLNPTYRSKSDVVLRFSRWPSWILERNEFINSKSPYHPNASHHVWAQSY